jgi:putative SOS response-associated peptidase YedK
VALAEGFYEWKKDEKSKAKQPYYIHYREEDRPLFFAALCDRWEDAEGASRVIPFAQFLLTI